MKTIRWRTSRPVGWSFELLRLRFICITVVTAFRLVNIVVQLLVSGRTEFELYPVIRQLNNAIRIQAGSQRKDRGQDAKSNTNLCSRVNKLQSSPHMKKHTSTSSRNLTKMILYRYAGSYWASILLLLIQVDVIQRTQQVALDEHYVKKLVGDSASSDDESSRGTHQDGLVSPFIILMSSDTISVAQLPMIQYGNISEIYHLPQEGSDSSITDFEEMDQWSSGGTEDDGSDQRQAANSGVEETSQGLKKQKKAPHREHADAREYEQMPQTATVNMTAGSMSLGKSEWQQIAAPAAERDREEVWQPQPTTQTNTNRKSAHEEDDARNGERKQLGLPRRRRSSNSLSADDLPASNHGGAELQTSATSSNAQTSRRVNRALESNAAQNATSAQSDDRQLNSALVGSSGGDASAEDGQEGGNASSSDTSQNQRRPLSSPAEVGKKRARFSDFDVHMALGYAFAADSAGRIHRIRLPLDSKPTAIARTSPSLTNQYGNSLSSERDDANAIDAGVRFEFALRQSKGNDHHRHHDTDRLNSSAVGAAPLHGDSVHSGGNHELRHEKRHQETTSTDSNDVNKVSQRGGSDVNEVTHEQSSGRQHPTISGGQSVLASAQKSSHGAPISVGLRTLDLQLADYQRDNLESNGATPRVIWSRNKHLRVPLNAADSTHQHSAASSSTKTEESQRQQQLANVKGALTATAGESNQMAGGRGGSQLKQHKGGHHEYDVSGVGADENQSDHLSEGSGKQRPMGGHMLRTQIAVDWLNNLLFVLDKCRLLVMDLQGNNELVLIDDFTVANRPIDIKVDPVNDFLFWLRVGKFHNTIYKLDLNVLSMQSTYEKLVHNTLRLRDSSGAIENGSSYDSEDLVPLVSHHYAHPVITNLPRNARIFTIDHKHSKIYVPLMSSTVNADPTPESTTVDQTKRDDAEIFASTGHVTHLNSTEVDTSSLLDDERNCTQNNPLINSEDGQILAYNLDGTDVGPLRTADEKSHITNLDSMQDLTLDCERNLLYWLTNEGKDLFEEFKENSSSIQPAQHYLNGKSYSKLIYFDNNSSNQPTSSKPKSNVRKIILILSKSVSSNRATRSDGLYQLERDDLAFSLKVRHLEGEPTRFSRNAPYIILGVTCLIVVAVYLVYALIFQQQPARVNENSAQCCEGSISGGSSSIGESHVDSNLNGFIHSSTISRWIAGPSVRSTDTSTFNRDVSSGNGAYDVESTNYEANNAIDEHYRASIANANQLFNLGSDRLANITEWPTNMHDRSNKLYVPVEVLQDDALSSIRRVSIDQLEIEKTAPLGEGHFGTVLQGKIKCTLHERSHLLDKSQTNVTFNGPMSPDSLSPPTETRTYGVSSASSGHGSSSSTSCEFTTANSCTEPTNNEDYLTPKNQLNSASSDYCAEMPQSSARDDSCIEYAHQATEMTSKVSTKLMVAIKKLKDNASAEEKRDFLQEAKLLANFDHPNIVHLIGICLDRGSTLIVMELMLGGDLIRYMQENTPNSMNNFADSLTYDDLLKVCLDIVNGCCYLEDMDYIHRDLAARNCLVSSGKREERVVKLADFGLARDIYKDSYYKKLNDSAMPLKWMAPECLIEQKFTKKSDVWSFGVVMWEVMSYCQEKPYVGVEPFFMKEHLASGGRLRQPDHCDESMYRLMNQCWQMQPENRPTFHECRAMLIEIRNEAHM